MTETAPPGLTVGGDEHHFHLYGSGQEFGPFTLQDLQKMAGAGQLRADSRKVPDCHGRLLR